jgi:large subunit ribosomal protein L23
MNEKRLYEVIRRPILTEKVMRLRENKNMVAFEVDINANKKEIKEAVEKLFNVKVKKVRTLVIRGKRIRRGLVEGKRSNWKKAYVELKEGDRIDYFEGA